MSLNDHLPRRTDQSFGEPYVTESGVTVIPVTRSRGGQPGGKAIGVFVIEGGTATWSPAVDADRIALIGVVTGLVSATLACLAVLRRPPWPTVTIHQP